MTRCPLRMGWGNLKSSFALLRGRGFDLLHPLNLLEFALRLGGLGVFRPKAVHEIHQAADFALLMLVSGELLLFGASRCAR